MAKWILENHEGVKTWYSGDIIEKIKDICERKPFQALEKILKLIEKEDK